MIKNRLTYLLPILIFAILLWTACTTNDYSPKPRGYFRIDLPKKAYQNYSAKSYTFDYPVYATIIPDSVRGAKSGWVDMVFPQFNGRIHLSYLPVTSPKIFNEIVEDARSLAFMHTVKATAIDEGVISYPNKKVYGIFYTIDGNTASPVQFFLTDSTKNYLRGALYFNEEPRLDSIKPVLDFIKKDVDVMIKSFEWK